MAVGFTLVPSNAVASAVFVEQYNKRAGLSGLVIPQKILLIGNYLSSKTPTPNVARLITSADEAASVYGNGSMLHIMAMHAFAGSGLVPVYALPVAAGTGSPTGTITVTGTSGTAGTLALYIAGMRVAVTVTASLSASDTATAIAAAINAKVELPVTATALSGVVTCTAKWAGLTGNNINIAQNLNTGDLEQSPTTTALTIVAMSGGSTNSDITAALAGLGDTWYTFIANPFQDSANLTLMEAAWTARINPGVKRPFVCFYGYVGTYAAAVNLATGRNSPATTIIPVEGSPNMPLEIAAAAAGICANSAQVDPARPWRTLLLPGIRAGTGAPWTYAEMNAAELTGLSTTKAQIDKSVRIHDLVTSYKDNALGADDDAWRYPETIINIAAKMYSLDNLFSGSPFDRAIVIDDNSVTSKPYAISPNRVTAFIRDLVDTLWIPEAWSRYRDSIVNSIVAEIDSTNPGRINVSLTDYPSTGLRIMAVLYNWTFGLPAPTADTTPPATDISA
jgi:phage tail sheath gpL-like